MSSRLLASLPLVLCVASLFAQQQPVTAGDYAHAAKFLAPSVDPLVSGIGHPVWIGDTSELWFRKTTATASGETTEFVLADAASASQQPAFDHAKMAAALGALLHRTLDPQQLPIAYLSFSPDLRTVTVYSGRSRYVCDRAAVMCTAPDSAKAPAPRNESISPDGKRAVFIRDWNLWIRDVATGEEKQLTTDGVKDFGYATDNAGWISSDRPVVLWSPDSKKIATFQQDQRQDGDMYLVSTRVGHPELQQWKYPLPGDEHVTMIERVILSVDSGRMVRLKMPPDQHRSTVCDNVVCGYGPDASWVDVEWSPDAKTLAFVSTSRDHKDEHLRVADAATGAVRDVYEEKVATQYESGFDHANWYYLPQSNEFIWFSERSNWGHLYLYDLGTGQLKNQITTGNWDVAQVLRVDDAKRQIWFTANDSVPGENPYYYHLYRIDFDGTHLTPLTPEPGDHLIASSGTHRWFVDADSTPDTPPTTVVRDEDGKIVLSLGKDDISRLVATGWKPPIPITVKARDGKTDLYGLMFEPMHFDPAKKYPIIDHIYPGPQIGSVGTYEFYPARGDCQALAELGFIVVEIDGMGTPWRSKKFHEAYFGNMGDNTLPDQVAGMKELAQKYPWIDINRAGIYGHSGGGYATADAMFRYPDFFKVGISESGNHDNREYEDDWAEKWQGLLERNPDGTTNYDNQANQLQAKNLKGHLLLA
ncbi:MAG TPA: DPP IV N-terminal domain-containing protein, partial [Acidobacteriaceae bacterium]|nr:DPP IV N-terminal domain-containing protein [Acidobacteriaceae bacterium]